MTEPGLLADAVARNVRSALIEDVGSGDITAELIDTETSGHARIITREPGVFCGEPWIRETCRQVDPEIELEMLVSDGDTVRPDDPLFRLRGRARSLLTAERTVLNFVQLLSGTATLTARFAALISHTRAKLLDTRKTVPGLRLAQKYAVRCGGGTNHRIGLFDAFLIKENHIIANGSIANAVARAHQLHPNAKLEVEVESYAQLEEAIEAKADIAMLDNFDLERTADAVQRVDGRILLEASGGLDETTITDVAETGVDYISIGRLTKFVTPLDLSMRFID